MAEDSVLDVLKDLLQGRGEQYKEDLNYRIAVSSGLSVAQDIPELIGRRAGWASQQGANFIELYVGNPAQLITDEETLLNNAKQLDQGTARPTTTCTR